MEKNNTKNIDEKKQNNKAKIKKSSYIIAIFMWIIVLILGFAHFKMNQNMKNPKPVFIRTNQTTKNETDNIYIYYPEENSLNNVEIKVPKIENRYDLLNNTILETVNKLEENKFIPIIDKEKISFYIVGNQIYLDLPKTTFENVRNGKTELLIIYSFVNSLTNIEGIESVRFLIDHNENDKVKFANLSKNYKYSKNI